VKIIIRFGESISPAGKKQSPLIPNMWVMRTLTWWRVESITNLWKNP